MTTEFVPVTKDNPRPSLRAFPAVKALHCIYEHMTALPGPDKVGGGEAEGGHYADTLIGSLPGAQYCQEGYNNSPDWPAELSHLMSQAHLLLQQLLCLAPGYVFRVPPGR